MYLKISLTSFYLVVYMKMLRKWLFISVLAMLKRINITNINFSHVKGCSGNKIFFK